MYVELHAHSAYSFLDGASLPEELAVAAAEYGYEAFALTDHDNVCGAMEFAQACDGLGVRPIVGAELTVVDGGGDANRSPFHLTLLVEDAIGWHNLCRLLTEAHAETRPRPDRDPLPPSLALESLLERSEGLVCLSGCARDGAAAGNLDRGEARRAEALARRLRRASVASASGSSSSGRSGVATGRATAGSPSSPTCSGSPRVATGNVHAHDRRRAELQDALVAVRGPYRARGVRARAARQLELGARLAGGDGGPLRRPSRGGRRDRAAGRAAALRPPSRARLPLPRLGGPRGRPAPWPRSAVAGSSFATPGMRERPEAERRLEEELRVIRGLGLSGFFLLHFDLLELAREVAAEVRGPDSARDLLPPGRGRGSSVSSVVCYLTGLSHVDPVRAGLFLGRFLNDEITEMPDIDLDFPRDIRERLIPRVHERYGRERAALVARLRRLPVARRGPRPRQGAGAAAGEIERVARDGRRVLARRRGRARHRRGDRCRAGGIAAMALAARLAREAWGLPRHVSQHPGGMVLSTRPLIDLCPVQPAAMEGRQIVQWDKDSCADAGFSEDRPARARDAVGGRAMRRVDRGGARRADRPLADPARRPGDLRGDPGGGDDRGVPDREPGADADAAAQSLPETIDDLTVQVALVRPGPIQGGAVHPYLERKTAAARGPRLRGPLRAPERSSRSSPTRSGRSSSRTR